MLFAIILIIIAIFRLNTHDNILHMA